jgi:hypothetical protein
MLVQTNGNIVVGGQFNTLGGGARTNLGRLKANGDLDPDFVANAPAQYFDLVNVGVRALALRKDGKILVGGSFVLDQASKRTNFCLLNADGSLNGLFAGGAGIGGVTAMALQADGSIVVGGDFDTLVGVSRWYIGRVGQLGSLDGGFGPAQQDAAQVNTVRCLALQSDGKIIVGGVFKRMGEQPRNNIARLTSGNAALQSLTIDSTGQLLTWNRSGTGPEVEQVTFEFSTNATTYAALGAGVRTNGGWQLSGAIIPVGGNFYLRARGRAVSGQYNGSGSLVESVRRFYQPVPPFLLNSVLLVGGSAQVSFTGIAGASYTVFGSSNLITWLPLGAATNSISNQFLFTDTNAFRNPKQFYKGSSP